MVIDFDPTLPEQDFPEKIEELLCDWCNHSEKYGGACEESCSTFEKIQTIFDFGVFERGMIIADKKMVDMSPKEIKAMCIEHKSCTECLAHYQHPGDIIPVCVFEDTPQKWQLWRIRNADEKASDS